MKALSALIVCLLVVTSCAPEKTIPVPTRAMAVNSGEDLAVLQNGYRLYMAQCTRCHEPMMPSDVSKEDWHIVTPGMAWNAGISDAAGADGGPSDADAVLKYVLAAKAAK